MKAKGVKTMKERRPLVAGINSTSSVDPAVEDEFVFAHKPKATESTARQAQRAETREEKVQVVNAVSRLPPESARTTQPPSREHRWNGN